jgi:sec-independent protein translocase protein TatA
VGATSERITAMPSPTELLVIFAIILVLFGASKIPALGRGLGEGIRNFKKGLSSDDSSKPENPNNG